MSKVLIDRELLERAVYALQGAYECDMLTTHDLQSVLDAPSGTPGLPVKAYYHEWTDLDNVRTRSVGLEVRRDFSDEPLVLESDALAGFATRDARIVELEEDRDSQQRCAIQAMAELATIKEQEPVAYIPVDRETGEEWHPVLKKGSGNICDYKPLYAAPVAKPQVVMPERLSSVINFLLGDGEIDGYGFGETPPHYPAFWWRSHLRDEVARLNATPVKQVSAPDGWTVERGYSPNGYVLHSPSGSMIRVCDSGMGGIETAFAMFLKAMLAAAPAAPAADAGIVDMYRHLQKVTPYRFKKIQDASITDGGDVMYFHKDRFDAALLADMAAHRAKGVV